MPAFGASTSDSDLMAHRVFVLNGPNLNMLGRRQPDLYGGTTLTEIERRCRRLATELDIDLFWGQSNQESQLLEWIHEAHDLDAPVVINPAGLSFYSMPLLDALMMLRRPVVEVHLTNIYRREPVYHRSLVSHAASAVIVGLGAAGYELALRGLAGLMVEGWPAG
jgi:3-dehydroquinate dehydratase-2